MGKIETHNQTKRMKELEDQGYYVIRLLKTNKNGIPDLLAIPKDAGVIFSEVKVKGKKPSPLQEFRMKELRNFGFKTEVYDGE